MQQVLLDEIDFAVDNGFPSLFEDEEEFSLNDNDRKWITGKFDAVQAQVDGVKIQLEQVAASVKPHGWKKMLFWLREWGLLATNVTIILTLFGFLLTAVYAVIHRDHDETVFETKTDGRLTDIEKTLASVKLSSLVSQPITANTPQQVARIIEAAKTPTRALDSSTVSDAGQALVSQSASNPDAWKAAGLLVDYKTHLNADLAPSTQGAQPFKSVEWNLAYQGSPDWIGYLSFIGRQYGTGMGQIRLLNAPDTWDYTQPGPAFFVLNGGTFDVDGYLLRGVIFLNSTIIYRGDPARMDRVYFVNCTFKMPPAKNTLQLAESILSPDAATAFSAN